MLALRSRSLVGSLLWGGLWGCTPAADAPVSASPPPDPVPVIDEAGAPDEPSAAAPPADAPEAIPQTINQRYAEQTDPAHWVGRFEREGREVFDHRAQIIDVLSPRAGQRIADVGAGTGLFTLDLARRVGGEGKIYAVDVQPYFLEHIASRAQQADLRNVETVLARQDAVGLPDGSVDDVLMCDAYHHVEQPGAYLRSLHRALRPGGRLWVIDYIAIEGQSDAWLVEHVRATPSEFRAEIERAGFVFVKDHQGILEENFFFEFERP